MQLTDAGTLSGNATMFDTPGSHGNIGNGTLAPNPTSNDPYLYEWSFSLPNDIGYWVSTLQPIPVADSLKSLVGDDLPAFFGAIAVLMVEGGHISDHGAEAGHAALNAAVEAAINNVLASIGPDHQVITQGDIDSVTSGINSKVSKAIEDAQSLLENIWSLSQTPVMMTAMMTRENNPMSTIFGEHVDALWNGEPVSFSRFALAHSLDMLEATANETNAEASGLLKEWEKRMHDRYGTTKLEVENKPVVPDSLDIPPVTPSKIEQDREQYLRDKFKMDGLSWSAWCHNGGGYRHIYADSYRREESKLHRAYGSYKGKKMSLEFTVVP